MMAESDDTIEISVLVVKNNKDVEGRSLEIDFTRNTRISGVITILAQKMNVTENLITLWKVPVFHPVP